MTRVNGLGILQVVLCLKVENALTSIASVVQAGTTRENTTVQDHT